MTNGGIVIRSMTEQDVEAVAALEAAAFSEPWSAQGFADALHQDGTIFLVAEEENSKTGILGYCGLYTSLDEGEITNVAVWPECRQRGIADRIIKEEMKRAHQAGVSSIYLEVRESNFPAIRLYEKNGFVSCGKRKAFYRKPTEDAIVMCATLTEIQEG